MLVYSASTSVRRNSQLAPTRLATWADRVSLSPKRSSFTATVSFSFTMGMMPKRKSSSKVFCTFLYCDSSARFSRVSRTCAHLDRRAEKALS